MSQPSRRHLLQGATALAAAPTLSAFAQDGYPARPVTLVVAYPAGGQNDITARVVTQPLGGYWGQPVLVDNRAGAGGAIGAQLVAKAAPDGYSLLLLAINHVILTALKSDLPYNLEKDFAPVSLMAVFPIILVVNPSLPFKSVKELVAYAKTHPGELTFASSGAGGGGHLAAELFCAKTGVKMLHVPYKGDAPALTDLLGGQTSCMFCAASSVLPFIRSGKLRALGISTTRRSALLPEVPTIAEAGVPGYESNSWVGVVAPAGTPAAVVDKISANLRRSLDDPAIKAKVIDGGGEAQAGTPQQFRDFIQAEKTKWAGIIKQANIHID